MGRRVKTLTGHPDRPDPFGGKVPAFPYRFDHPGELTESMKGASTLYNTYWIRFEKGGKTFGRAIENSKVLFQAARGAGVSRIVHISIANPAVRTDLPYYKGKAVLEDYLNRSGVSHAFIRPTAMFGDEGILINNIAWLLRYLPVFIVPGDGEYRIQPVHVDDVADLAVAAGQREENIATDAVGPEIFTFNELVRLIADVMGKKARVVHLAARVMYWMSLPMGLVLNDVMLTREEMEGLMANLLVSSDPPTGKIRLSEWLRANAGMVGRRYMSEVKRHYG